MRQRRAHRRRVVQDRQFPSGTYRHQVSASIQPADHAGHREFSRFTASNGAVEDGAARSVCQCSARERGRCRAGIEPSPWVSTRNCRTRLGAVHTLFLAVFIKVFLAVSGHGLKTLATHSVSTLVDFTQRAVNGFHRHLRLVTFQRIGRYPPPALPAAAPAGRIRSAVVNLQADTA